MTLLDWFPKQKEDGIWIHHYLLFAALKHRTIDLLMRPMGEFLMLKEWGLWGRFYLPPDGVRGKVVLDAGAGEGQSAWFFLCHGARRVVAVESDSESYDCLRRNVQRYGWPVECRHKEFTLDDLKGCDVVKIDVEGGESCLLGLPNLPHGCIEVHGELRQAFRERWPGLKFKKVSLRNALTTA